MTDRTEQLVRDAFAEEAARAADPREVLANVRGKRPRRSYGLVLATAAVVVVVAAVSTFVVPKVFEHSSVPVAGERQQIQMPAKPTNVLVVGVDENDYTDSIILVRFNDDHSTSVVSLPRDSWVSAGGAMTKLNQVYVKSGVDTLVAAVRDLTGVAVEHWAVVDMAAVGALTNAVGGVPVCLNAATEDKFAGADFPAGKQILNGDAALAFIRQRHGLPNGDLDRIVRLQVFLESMLGKADGNRWQSLVDSVKGHVRTDPGLDVLGVANALAVSDELHVGTIPYGSVDLQTPAAGSAVEVDPAQVKQFVANLQDTQATSPHTGVTCVN
jgi:LCP family protein required for cell wall assembly